MPPGPIMLIDDSFEDAELFEAILETNAPEDVEFIHFETGDRAVEHLLAGNGAGEATSHELPSLILLDLNLPGTDGRQILRQLKANETVRWIPIVVVTTSSNPADVNTCYESGANGFFTKPVIFEEYSEGVRVMLDYWFRVLKLPQP